MKEHAQPLHTLNIETFFFHQEFKSNYQIQHIVSPLPQKNRLHTHNFFEILFCTTSDLRFLINETVYPLRGNDLILLNNTNVHGFIMDHTPVDEDYYFERYVIEFDPNYVTDMCTYCNLIEDFENDTRPPIIHLTADQAQIFLRLFHKLKALETNDDYYGLQLDKKLIFTELLLQVVKFMHHCQTTSPLIEDSKFIRMQNILAYINSHLTDDISIKGLADLFFISPSHLSSSFKNFTGYTVNQYIINQRIMLATRLLKENRSVQEVAWQSGFNNYAHFIRTFKAYTGFSPKKYTKNSL